MSFKVARYSAIAPKGVVPKPYRPGPVVRSVVSANH